jgi:hypothetical protein
VIRLGFQKFICVIVGVGGGVGVGVGVGGLDWSRSYRLKPFLRNLRPKNVNVLCRRWPRSGQKSFIALALKVTLQKK